MFILPIHSEIGDRLWHCEQPKLVSYTEEYILTSIVVNSRQWLLPSGQLT